MAELSFRVLRGARHRSTEEAQAGALALPGKSRAVRAEEEEERQQLGGLK